VAADEDVAPAVVIEVGRDALIRLRDLTEPGCERHIADDEAGGSDGTRQPHGRTRQRGTRDDLGLVRPVLFHRYAAASGHRSEADTATGPSRGRPRHRALVQDDRRTADRPDGHGPRDRRRHVVDLRSDALADRE
jgi:hypothetical protein